MNNHRSKNFSRIFELILQPIVDMVDIGCRIKRMTGANETRNTETKDGIMVDQLPELTGSEKQIKWASEIREKFIAELAEDVEHLETTVFTDPEHVSQKEAWLSAYRQMLDCPRSSYWIDNRIAFSDDARFAVERQMWENAKK